MATVNGDGTVPFDQLRGAVTGAPQDQGNPRRFAAAGYTLLQAPRRNPLRRVFDAPLLMGPLAALALLGL